MPLKLKYLRFLISTKVHISSGVKGDKDAHDFRKYNPSNYMLFRWCIQLQLYYDYTTHIYRL